MKHSKIFFIAALIIFLVSCQTAERKPGLLIAGSNYSNDQQLLLNTMSEVLSGAKITLADDAFTASSEVIVEKYRGDQTNNLGRDYRKPDHFRLWIQGDTCIIEHIESGTSKVISGITCIPEPQ